MFIANSDALFELSLPVHNAALAGDILTTIQLNHEWREIVAGALQFYWRHGKDGLALDNEDLLDDLLTDLYNAETFMGRKFTSGNIDLVSNKTTTSTSGVAIAGTDVVWTPTYPNWKITFYNMDVVNSGAGESTHIIVSVVGESASGFTAAHCSGTQRRQMMAQTRFTDKPVGVAKTARLSWNVSGGTGTLNANSWLSYVIEEWD